VSWQLRARILEKAEQPLYLFPDQLR